MLRLFSLTFAVIVLGAGLILASPGASAQDDEVLDCEDFASQADAQPPTGPILRPGRQRRRRRRIACKLYDGFEDASTDLEPIEGDGADMSTARTPAPASSGWRR